MNNAERKSIAEEVFDLVQRIAELIGVEKSEDVVPSFEDADANTVNDIKIKKIRTLLSDHELLEAIELIEGINDDSWISFRGDYWAIQASYQAEGDSQGKFREEKNLRSQIINFLKSLEIKGK